MNCLIFFLFISQFPESNGSWIQLVESWPVETQMDHANIPDAAETWVAVIKKAKSTIDVEQFYATLDSDSPSDTGLNRILEALKERANAGVKIRFIFDQKFYERYPTIPDELKSQPNMEVRICDYSPQKGVVHNKMFTIDQTYAYIGSQNMDWRSFEHIQELGILIHDAHAATALQEVFDFDWQIAGGKSCESIPKDCNSWPSFPIQVTYNGQPHQLSVMASPKGCLPCEKSWDLPRILDTISTAKQKINLQFLSYHTINYDHSVFLELDKALRAAAERGVKVRFILADWSKSASQIGLLKELEKVENIQVKLISVPPWSKGFVSFARVIHAKYITVDDDWSWLGTSNGSGDYFYNSRNTGVLVEGEAFNQTLQRFFKDNWEGSYSEEVDPTKFYQAPQYRDKK